MPVVEIWVAGFVEAWAMGETEAGAGLAGAVDGVAVVCEAVGAELHPARTSRPERGTMDTRSFSMGGKQ